MLKSDSEEQRCISKSKSNKVNQEDKQITSNTLEMRDENDITDHSMLIEGLNTQNMADRLNLQSSISPSMS